MVEPALVAMRGLCLPPASLTGLSALLILRPIHRDLQKACLGGRLLWSKSTDFSEFLAPAAGNSHCASRSRLANWQQFFSSNFPLKSAFVFVYNSVMGSCHIVETTLNSWQSSHRALSGTSKCGLMMQIAKHNSTAEVYRVFHLVISLLG